MTEGIITRNDLQEIFSGKDAVEKKSHKFISILYGVGAIVALIGIIILLADNWQEIGFAGRILVSAGISVATFVSAFMMSGEKRSTISQVMFVISATLAPLGFAVLFEQFNVDVNRMSIGLVSAFLMLLYGAALLITKRNILILFTLMHEAILYGTIVSAFDGSENYIKEFIIALGVSWLFVTYNYKKVFAIESEKDEKEKDSLMGLLYGIASIMIYVPLSMYDGYWDALFFAVIFGGFYLSTFVGSKAILSLSAIFLTAQIIKISGTYFVNSLGWPIALIVIGFVVIGIGYASLSISKKYIKE